MHETSSPLAGKSVKIREGVTDPIQGQVVGGATFHVEDWWDKLTGTSWGESVGNPAALQYAFRMGATGGSGDDEVLYGKIEKQESFGVVSLGHLVHVSELDVGA